MIDGLTGDQRFFLAFAQAWRAKTRDAALRAQLIDDGHAPGAFRAQTVRNLDAWYDAFDVQAGREAVPGAGGARARSGNQMRVRPDASQRRAAQAARFLCAG